MNSVIKVIGVACAISGVAMVAFEAGKTTAPAREQASVAQSQPDRRSAIERYAARLEAEAEARDRAAQEAEAGQLELYERVYGKATADKLSNLPHTSNPMDMLRAMEAAGLHSAIPQHPEDAR